MADVKKTIVRYEGRGPLPDYAVDGSDEILPRDEGLTDEDRNKPPLIDWPDLRTADVVSPRRRTGKRDAA